MSKIQWTDRTSNPIHLVKPDGTHGGHWCRKKSPGCANCYSEAQNQSGFFKFASHSRFAGEVPSNLILDRKVLEEWIDEVFGAMAIASHHTFQLLTKRPDRMANYFADPNRARWIVHKALDLVRDEVDPLRWKFGVERFDVQLPLKHVWLGTSVENQEVFEERSLPLHSLHKLGWTTFYSVEPLLEEVNLRLDTMPVSWVIAGGESGAKSRPCHVEWLRAIVRQGQKAKVPVFVKQLGSNPISSSPYISGIAESHYPLKLKDSKGGNWDEWDEDLKVHQFPVQERSSDG